MDILKRFKTTRGSTGLKYSTLHPQYSTIRFDEPEIGDNGYNRPDPAPTEVRITQALRGTLARIFGAEAWRHP
jgi:hypothetical protein